MTMRTIASDTSLHDTPTSVQNITFDNDFTIISTSRALQDSSMRYTLGAPQYISTDTMQMDADYGIGSPSILEYPSKMSVRSNIYKTLAYIVLSLLALYWFMVAISWIGSGFMLVLGCEIRLAIDYMDNPFAGLIIGCILAALLHSSSTVTSIIVALVGSDILTLRDAVYIVMGANVGTCITAVIVAFGQVVDRQMFERAMGAAIVHDMYNICSILVMFPIELIFHPLERLSLALSSSDLSTNKFKSPLSSLVTPVANLLLVVDTVSLQQATVDEKYCAGSNLFIKSGLFSNLALSDGTIGIGTVVIGFCILIAALICFVKALSCAYYGATSKIVARALSYHGYVNILVGFVITLFLQSSTAVTSILTPMTGFGVITLEQVYPIIIGANLGTASTALLAALVLGKFNGLAVALVHFWFNFFGMLLFYPIPITRQPILGWSQWIAYVSGCWPTLAIIIAVILFVGGPGYLMGIVLLCIAESTALNITGYILVVLSVVIAGVGAQFFFNYGGREKFCILLEKKRSERDGVYIIAENQLRDDPFSSVI